MKHAGEDNKQNVIWSSIFGQFLLLLLEDKKRNLKTHREKETAQAVDL